MTVIADWWPAAVAVLNIVILACMIYILRKMITASALSATWAMKSAQSETATLEYAARAEQARQECQDALQDTQRLVAAAWGSPVPALAASTGTAVRTMAELPCLPCDDTGHGFPGAHCDNHGVAITTLAGCPYGKPLAKDAADA